LAMVGLVSFIKGSDLPSEQDYRYPARYFRDKDEAFYSPSLDFLNKA
jgi:hypothetical protein